MIPAAGSAYQFSSTCSYNIISIFACDISIGDINSSSKQWSLLGSQSNLD